MIPLQEIKPKNARSKRELAKRQPLTEENPKNGLFLRYTNSSSLLNHLLTDLHSLKQPFAIKFNKKNSIHPFEDPSSLEFFAQKNDASQLVFASHSKKRPHALTWVRCFGHTILDMLELLVIEDTARCMSQFKGSKCRSGLKAMLNFSGSLWEDPAHGEYALAKSIFTDFFRGAEVPEVDVEGLQLLITFAAGELDNTATKPPIHMRCWRIETKRNPGKKIPKIDVVEIGPRIDFRVGRTRIADDARMKTALKVPRGIAPKARKNVETDFMGDKMGRIHLGRQDLKELQTRKMKGLKRSKSDQEDGDVMEEDDVIDDNISLTEMDVDSEVETKKIKVR